MKISKKILLISLIFLIIFASGCSKNFFGVDNGEPDSNLFGMAGDLEKIEEKSGEEAPSAGSTESAGTGQSFGSVEQGMPGDGSTGSFSAEPFAEDRGQGESLLSDGGDEATGQSFGSAEQGMPGNGSTGSFSAEPFAGDRGQGGSLLSDSGDKAPEATSEFLKEETLREGDPSFAPDWEFNPGQSFGSAEQGMPGDGSTGSFSAEPFTGDRDREGSDVLSVDGDKGETPEPFLTEKGEDMVASLPQDEEVRRLLPYHSTNSLTDIHFAFDKYDLDDKSRAILKENAAYLKVHPVSRIEIEGHCDERGSNAYNISLGERRAQATKSYLISLGVDESQIRTISYGEERPFCFESNEACWYQNRRAHFLVSESIQSMANPPK
jgi:peptidoglycan-associated lipoprotein